MAATAPQTQQFLARARAWRMRSRILPRFQPQHQAKTVAEPQIGSIEDLKLACLSPSSKGGQPLKLLQKARAWTRRRRMSWRVESLQAKKEPLIPGVHHTFVEAKLTNGRLLKIEDNASGAVITELNSPAKGTPFGKVYHPKPWVTNRRLTAMARRFDLKGKYDVGTNCCQHFVQKIVAKSCDEMPPRNPNYLLLGFFKWKLQYSFPVLLLAGTVAALHPCFSNVSNVAACGGTVEQATNEEGHSIDSAPSPL